MVIGIGTDIIEIERIGQSVERFGRKFLDKVYTENEIEYCMAKANKYQHFAARFAAKEAVAKALSDGWTTTFNWKDIEIFNEPGGKPLVKLSGDLKEYLGDDKELKLTISHSRDNAICFAIVFEKGK